MTFVKLICAAAVVSVAAAAPAAAGHKHRHHGHHHHHVEGSLYTHNYGPPIWPGETFATYDGPLRALCKQGAAAYRGQDGRRYPCY
ncbi:hypothetical protein SR870_00155 [Rhodopseudomonas palustris]|uniref:hypothetical protein n=1 Tax=Rhodopseudomonas palustris TaxID=1076 RepID=UPI002ACEF6E2|nr:hypothetical protein [Rhodopseudomonas palustris]WQG99744.1 hypothetical protein SR870_00155 [Rhodopseudomonas palustris]